MTQFAIASRFAVGLVFVLASVGKLRAPDDFAHAVRGYSLLPLRLVRPVVEWLPRVELAVGVCLVAGLALPVAAAVVIAMLVVFDVAVGINLARGRTIDCGCSGVATPLRIGPALLARNAFLAGAAAVVAVVAPDSLAPPVVSLARADGVSGTDAAALVVVGVVAVALYAATADALRFRRAVAALREAAA